MANVVKFFTEQVMAAVRSGAVVGLDLAGRALVADIRQTIGIEGDGMPSKPGEVPRRQSGELQDSIGYVVHKDIPSVTITADAPYALELEFGTSRMAPRPYLRRGLIAYAEKYGPRHFSTIAGTKI